VIKLEVDVRTAVAMRQVLFEEQKIYTYDPVSVPSRINEIRNVISELDTQIEEELKKEID